MADVEKSEVVPIRPQIAGKITIMLSEADAEMAREAAAQVAVLHAAIGEERTAYLLRERELLAQLQTHQQDYGSTVRALSKRYITTKGQFNFSPDLGAFIGFEQTETKEDS